MRGQDQAFILVEEGKFLVLEVFLLKHEEGTWTLMTQCVLAKFLTSHKERQLGIIHPLMKSPVTIISDVFLLKYPLGSDQVYNKVSIKEWEHGKCRGPQYIKRHYVEAISKIQNVRNSTGQRDPVSSPYKWQRGKRESVCSRCCRCLLLSFMPSLCNTWLLAVSSCPSVPRSFPPLNHERLLCCFGRLEGQKCQAFNAA